MGKMLQLPHDAAGNRTAVTNTVGDLIRDCRYYDLATGRFTSRDRFKGFENRPASQNPYTYCENDPVNFLDPDGFWSKSISFYKYLGSGAYVSGSLGGSVTSWGRYVSVWADLYLRVTYGAIGIWVAGTIAGWRLAAMISDCVVSKTYLKEIIIGIFGVYLGSFVFNRMIGLVKKAVRGVLSWMDGLIIRIPGATAVAWEGPLRFSWGWSI